MTPGPSHERQSRELPAHHSSWDDPQADATPELGRIATDDVRADQWQRLEAALHAMPAWAGSQARAKAARRPLLDAGLAIAQRCAQYPGALHRLLAFGQSLRAHPLADAQLSTVITLLHDLLDTLEQVQSDAEQVSGDEVAAPLKARKKSS